MALQTYAIVNPSNIVINMVVWDGTSTYNVAPNTLVLAQGNANAQIGGTYIGGVFTPPSAPPVTGIFFLNSPSAGANLSVPSPVSPINGAFRKLYVWLNPAGSLLTLTLTLPANPQDGDDYYLKSSQNITALTLTLPAGTTLFNFSNPSAIVAQTGYHIVYSAQLSAWFLF
jgi:hypothetical protein